MFNKSNCNINDMGKKPYVVNIKKLAKCNDAFRVALWTGEHLQTTLMSINVGDDIGKEMHSDVDQYIMIADGCAKVYFGTSRAGLKFYKDVGPDDAIYVPAGTWHNVVNNGRKPLKVISVYGPTNHPFGTYQKTKKDAEEH